MHPCSTGRESVAMVLFFLPEKDEYYRRGERKVVCFIGKQTALASVRGQI